MKNTFLIITSIASQEHPILKQYAEESLNNDVKFIVIGDAKSPKEIDIKGCDFYSLDNQGLLNLKIARQLPLNSYSRKNIGYLLAMSKGAETIIETDDDNIPLPAFWSARQKQVTAHLLINDGWVNVYKYFTDANIWPRGFALQNIKDTIPSVENKTQVECPIQMGLADGNPDVDSIYRLILPLPIIFNKSGNIALGINSFCPFNSQNTTWFQESFPLLYLPSYCSFRMTDIWRSFIAQRIAWTCGWSILFHNSTVWQERNNHNLMNDFKDEISGYINNQLIYDCLKNLDLKEGIENITFNMRVCYLKLIQLGIFDSKEMILLESWFEDINSFKKF